MITDGLYSFLSSQSPLTTVVGTRIYPAKLPQDPTLPCILYSIISGVPISRLSQNGDMDRTLIQFDCWAKDYEAARGLAGILRDVLEGYVGVMGSHTVRQVRCIDPGFDDFDEVPEDYRVIAEYELWHSL